MAKEVIHSLGKMKLTTEEEEVIEVSDEGRQEEIESCSLSLLGKFLMCRPFNKNAATNTVRKAWGLEGVQILEVGSNLFQFNFHTEFEMERAFRGGPWTFDNQALMLYLGPPFEMISPRVAAKVGSRLGVVVEVEKRQKVEAQCLFMRVRVAIPISKPIRRGSFVSGSDDARHRVNFKYERLAMFYYFCGVMGHDLRHCASYYATSKNNVEMVCQYGDWMKATGSRSSMPTRKSRSNVEEGMDQTYKRSSERMQAMPADENPDSSQTEDETHGKGDDAISGTVSVFQEKITDINAGSVTDYATRKAKNTLGKRVPSQITEEELKEAVVELRVKRSKIQEEDTTHAAARVMAHPCRPQ
ncbi:hypothetical protein SO802_001004 [Lithocarpus litseifolius]|uniref:DUF4283 domain-containing protein n=1 Tax=Lithocarpus litseifolius TaxID=425828 RepID=A0AAW2DT52_9ROSI